MRLEEEHLRAARVRRHRDRVELQAGDSQRAQLDPEVGSDLDLEVAGEEDPGEQLTRALLADRSRSQMPDTLAILEVKTTGTIPGWVTSGVLAAGLTQRTVPKYVIAMDGLGIPETVPGRVYS